MTKEKAILILQELWKYEQVKYKDYEVRTALEMAIKALEQEPILDKIRAEIEEMVKDEWNNQGGSVTQGLEDALEIIDKYRQEAKE